MADSDEPILLTVFETDRTQSQLKKLIEGLESAPTEWVMGTTIHPQENGKYVLQNHLAGHPGNTGTVQVMENQLWATSISRYIEGVLQSEQIPYDRARLRAKPSFLIRIRRTERIPLGKGDIDVRYAPKTEVRFVE